MFLNEVNRVEIILGLYLNDTWKLKEKVNILEVLL